MSRERRVNPVFLLLPVVVLLPLVWVFARSFGNDPRAVPAMLVGQPAPDFALTAVDGSTVKLSEHRGKPVVINFWSTWCVPCKQEHPLLLQAPSLYPDVTFLGVVFSDQEPKVRAYLRREGQAFPQLLDPSGRVAMDYGVAGVPETYFIDTRGTVFHKHNGALYPKILDQLVQQARGN